MNRQFSKIFLLLMFFGLGLLFPKTISAACAYPSYCNQPAGTCGTSCVGGPCYIGNTVCTATNTPTCTCSSNGGSCENGPGQGCDPTYDIYGGISGYQGVCTCTYVYNCGCANPNPQYGCCTDTGPVTCCGPGGGTCGWTTWSACSAPCGGGTQTRTNTCTGVTETQACNTAACCGWTDWGSCSQPCGGGTQSRTNTCDNSTQNQACNTGACPTCTAGYSAWSACSASCGGGTQSRTNLCNGQVETQACNTQCCAGYSAWSACSASCGGGTRTRTNLCTGAVDSELCNTEPCCGTTPGAWSACSATCGTGTRSRANTCVSGGIEYEACNTCDLNGCSCPVACGQNTACGTCSNSDFGPPGPVTLTPSSGNVQLPSNRQVTLSWTPADKAEYYNIRIFPTGTAAANECTAANSICVNNLTTTSYTFTAPLGVANYTWKVRPFNSTCDAATYLSATASDEYLTGEGAPYDMSAAKALDGSNATMWNAGGFPSQYIEIDLKTARTVRGITLVTGHNPAGTDSVQVYVGSTTNPATLAYSGSTFMNPADTLNVAFATDYTNVRYMRVVTSSSAAAASWVGWLEATPLYSDGSGSTWTSGNFTLVGPLSGNVYLDQGFSASLDLNGKCVAGPLPGQNPGGIATIQGKWSSGGSANGSFTGSTFSIANIPNENNLGVIMAPDSSLWRCTCPNNCVYAQGATPGFNVHDTNANFYIASVAQPWWQSQNGLLYAGNTTGNAILSLIPTTCTGTACKPRLSLQNAQATSESGGIPITGGGDIDVDPDSSLRYTKLRTETSQSRIIGSTYNGPKENYQYFYNLYSMGSSPTTDFTGSKPTAAPANGRAYYANGSVTISSPWTLTATDSMVIFVNGNLTVNSQITVPQGGFLAFIVNGNIVFPNTLGSTSGGATTNVAQGKTTTQSSTYPLPAAQVQASNATDGNTDGNWNNNSVSHTNSELNAWLTVDLGASYDISSINLYNRTDCCASRLTNFYMYVSDNAFTSTNPVSTQGQAGVTTYSFAGTAGSPTTQVVGRTGRYVRVQLAGTDYLNITELQVMGTPAAAGGSSVASLTPTVAGVFIANGQLNVQGGAAGGDLPFVGEGTFVGWQGVVLGRQYTPLSNNDTNPTEFFRFRPDFVINVPARMTRPLYTWQETN
jgi:hypothetical protein